MKTAVQIALYSLSALGALAYALTGIAPAEPSKTQATPVLVAVSESETPEPQPTVEPTPTVDAFATYQAQSALNSSAQAKAAADNLEAARTLAESQDRLGESNVRTAQIYAAQKQSDNEAEIELAALEVKRLEEENKKRELENKNRELEIMSIEQNRQAIYDWVILIVTIIIAVVVLFGVVVFFVNTLGQPRRRQTSAKNPTVIYVKRDDGASERISEPPYTDHENFIDWCAAVIAGQTVAVDFWEQAGRFVGDYRETHRWLARWKLMMRHPKTGVAVLNPTGERVITRWMVNNPLPHPYSSEKNAPLSPVSTESVSTEAEGEEFDL